MRKAIVESLASFAMPGTVRMRIVMKISERTRWLRLAATLSLGLLTALLPRVEEHGAHHAEAA